VTGPPRAALYRPVRRVDGRAVRARDEDAFTLAATVMERLVRGLPPPARWELVTTGAARDVPDPMYALLLGTAVHRREASSSQSLPSALPTLHVAVELSGPEAGEDRAVAVRGDVRGGAVPAPTAERLWQEVQQLGPEEVVRLGGAEPRVGAAVGPPLASAKPRDELGRVSEGALLPHARYLEGVPSHWRLEGEQCGECGRVGFPARGRCRGCGRSDRLTTHSFPFDGHSVVATTRIGPGAQPTEFDAQVDQSGGYQVVLAELGPTARATLQATDPELGPISLGDRVATALRRTYAMEGEWRYARKAFPDRPVG